MNLWRARFDFVMKGKTIKKMNKTTFIKKKQKQILYSHRMLQSKFNLYNWYKSICEHKNSIKVDTRNLNFMK